MYSEMDGSGAYVLFDEAQAEIDSRDKLIAELTARAAELEFQALQVLAGKEAQAKRIAELEAQLATERHLLVRYMAGVIDAEGESYIENCRGYVVEFTDGEKTALRAVEPLAIAEMNK